MARLVLAALAALCVAAGARAAYPEKPIRFVVPSAAGGSPEEFLALAKRETVKWADVVKRSGAKVD